MSDPKNLDSVEPIKSVEEIERETGGAATSTTGQDLERDDRSLLGTLIAPFTGTDEGTGQDSTTAAPSETTENSEG